MLLKLARFSYFILFTWSLVRILANIRTNPHIIVPWIFLKQYLQLVVLAGTQSQYHSTWSYSWTLHQKLELHVFISKSSEFFSTLFSLLWLWKLNSLLRFITRFITLHCYLYLPPWVCFILVVSNHSIRTKPISCHSSIQRTDSRRLDLVSSRWWCYETPLVHRTWTLGSESLAVSSKNVFLPTQNVSSVNYSRVLH